MTKIADARAAAPTAAVAGSTRRGFTLLEVLAAVMIFAIWYLVIAEAAMVGLRAEGENKRRIEAGLLADRRLAEIELDALTGAQIEALQDEQEEDIYRITTSVAPMQGNGAGDAAALQDLAAATLAGGAPAAPTDLPSLIASAYPDLGPNLYELIVTVHWLEGADERSITRQSYAFDVSKAAEAFEEAGLVDQQIAGDLDQPALGEESEEEQR